MKKFVLMLLVLCSFFTMGCLEYSTGQRPGVITKFSTKGMLFKTYEGKLAVSSGDAYLINKVWDFSVDKDGSHGENSAQVVSDLEKAAETGKRVSLTYVEERWVGFWRADTNYFVTKVKFIE